MGGGGAGVVGVLGAAESPPPPRGHGVLVLLAHIFDGGAKSQPSSAMNATGSKAPGAVVGAAKVSTQAPCPGITTGIPLAPQAAPPKSSPILGY